MKETTVINKIKKLVENIDYERIYVEIETKNNKYTLEQEKEKNIAGFKSM